MEKQYQIQVFLIDSTDPTQKREIDRRVFEIDEVEGQIYEWAEEKIEEEY